MNQPPEGEPWVWLTREMLESQAWRSLTAGGHRVIERLMIEHMNHGGTRNGDLVSTYVQFQSHGISRKAVSAAIGNAQRAGFIDIVERGQRGYGIARRPSRYALTWLPRC